MKLHGLTIGSLLLCLGVAGVSAAGCTVTTSGGAGTSSTGSGSGGSGSGGQPTPTPTAGDFPGCAADSSLTCDGNAIGISCPSGTSPDSTSYDCSVPTTNPDGTDGYCCITYDASSPCAPDPSVTGCVFPSYGFSCSTPGDTPDMYDCTLNCSVDQGTGTFCCDDNGACSGGGSSGGTSSGGTGGCVADSTLACDAGSDGVSCPPGGNPEADFPGYICSAPSPQPDGSDGYCCATGFSGSTCSQDPTVDGCAYPSVGFSCAGTDSPDQADPSLNCSTGVADPTTGDTLYCCQ